MVIALTEYARRHGKKPDTARQMALRGGFKTAQKIGRDWMIDENELWPDRRLKAKDVFTLEADSLDADTRRRVLKLEQAKEYSGWRSYPSTCEAIFSNIPSDMFERYTAKQLGEIAALIKRVYDKGVQDGMQKSE